MIGYKEFDQQLHKDVLALSSGTIASLSGESDYEAIETIQQDLAHVVRAFSVHRQFRTWVDVWNFYRDTCPAIRRVA